MVECSECSNKCCCSRKCRFNSKALNSRGVPYKDCRCAKTCSTCNKAFTAKGNIKYCSDKCKAKSPLKIAKRRALVERIKAEQPKYKDLKNKCFFCKDTHSYKYFHAFEATAQKPLVKMNSSMKKLLRYTEKELIHSANTYYDTLACKKCRQLTFIAATAAKD